MSFPAAHSAMSLRTTFPSHVIPNTVRNLKAPTTTGPAYTQRSQTLNFVQGDNEKTLPAKTNAPKHRIYKLLLKFLLIYVDTYISVS